jgi:hypothetical protein
VSRAFTTQARRYVLVRVDTKNGSAPNSKLWRLDRNAVIFVLFDATGREVERTSVTGRSGGFDLLPVTMRRVADLSARESAATARRLATITIPDDVRRTVDALGAAEFDRRDAARLALKERLPKIAEPLGALALKESRPQVRAALLDLLTDAPAVRAAVAVEERRRADDDAKRAKEAAEREEKR